MKKIWLTALICGLFLCAVQTRAEGFYPAPPFKMTDQDGRTITLDDLKGKVWVADFIFTRCGGACPVMTQKMIGLAEKVRPQNVRFVSISVDPENDTPATLKQYAQRQGASDPRFVFLTGDKEGIYDLAQKGFHMMAAPARGNDPIMHDERFALIDTEGNVRGIYHSTDDAAMTRLASDTGILTNPWIMRFPAINASLNATSGILICLAMMLIQARMVRAHATAMITAVLTSAAFLTCYLTLHYLKWQAGSATTEFPPSSWKPFYLTILISHSILAVVIVPMILVTLVRAWNRKWDSHRKIAKPTFWLWLYVSATGVLVYFMLYQLAPRITAANGA